MQIKGKNMIDDRDTISILFGMVARCQGFTEAEIESLLAPDRLGVRLSPEKESRAFDNLLAASVLNTSRTGWLDRPITQLSSLYQGKTPRQVIDGKRDNLGRYISFLQTAAPAPQ
jgi:hypothetical protein